MSVWRNRIVGFTMEVPEDLLANPMNPRRHPGEQRDAMRGSLDELGWIDAVIVNDVTGRMIDGHLRCEEAISEGAPVIPVLHVELDENEERLALAVFDPISALAKNDQERLDDLIASIDTENPALIELLGSLSGEDIDGAPIHAPSKKNTNTFTVVFNDDVDQSEFLGTLSLVPGNGPADKLLRLLRNAVTT